MGHRGDERRRRQGRDRARLEARANAERRQLADGITPDIGPKWAEFLSYDARAIAWIAAGNIAVTPGPVERIGHGVSMYVHARDSALFAAAATMITADVSSVPAGRTGSNVDGEFLMRALLLVRRDTGLAIGDPEPWHSRCPECSAPFDRVVDHSFRLTGEITMAGCAAGHRWRV